MSGMSLKEKAVAAVLGMILLYAAAVGLWFLRQEKEWVRSRKAYDDARRKYAQERELIGERRYWDEEYESAKSSMPAFDVEQTTDIAWRRKIDNLAAGANIVFRGERKTGAEISEGDIYELPITASRWEGSLEAVVKFMYALESGKNGIFAIKEVSMDPISKSKVFTGYLRGNFTVTCAYTREAEVSHQEDAPATAEDAVQNDVLKENANENDPE